MSEANGFLSPRISKLRTIAPREAQELLENHNKYRGQRGAGESAQESINKSMGGKFRRNGSVAVVNIGNDRLLANGQKTLKGIIDIGKPMPVLYEEWDAATDRDMVGIYGCYDNGMSRSASHLAIASAASANVDCLKITPPLCASAAAMMVFGFNFTDKATKIERAELLFRFKKEMKFVDRMFRQKHRAVIARASVVCAMFATFRVDPVAAEDFWDAVREGGQLNPDDARKVLRDYLLVCRTRHPSSAVKVRTADAQREQFIKCIHAWNAWREGRRITKLHYSYKAVEPTPV